MIAPAGPLSRSLIHSALEESSMTRPGQSGWRDLRTQRVAKSAGSLEGHAGASRTGCSRVGYPFTTYPFITTGGSMLSDDSRPFGSLLAVGVRWRRRSRRTTG
jgi:hypothetical protein